MPLTDIHVLAFLYYLSYSNVNEKSKLFFFYGYLHPRAFLNKVGKALPTFLLFHLSRVATLGFIYKILFDDN